MIVRAAGDDVIAARLDGLGEHLGIVHDGLGVDLERRLQRLMERHGLRRNNVHERATLEAGKHRGVDLLGDILVVGEDDAAARTAERLVRRRRHDMSVRHRRGVHATCHEACDMGHIHHQVRADAVGNGAEARPVPEARVGGAAGQDQLGLVGLGNALDLVEVDELIFLAHAIGHDLEPLAAHVDRRAVREMAARIEIEAHEGVAGLQQRQEHGLVHLAARVRLNVRELGAEKLFGALDRERLDLVDVLAAAIVTLARITFGVLVGENGAGCFEHGTRDDVLRRDKLDLGLLAHELATDGTEHLGISLGEGLGEEGVLRFTCARGGRHGRIPEC